MRTPHFWLLFSVYMFTGLGSFFVSLHQLAFAVDIGFDKLYAAQVLGMGAFLAVPGIVVTGTLSDYLGREISAILAYGFSILGVFCALLITSPDQHLLLWLHACFFGLTWGARGPAITAKTADLFPGPRLGTILGVITIGSGLGAAIGSWGAGWIHDLTGSYRVAFMLSIASYVCGTAAFWALRRPPVRRSAATRPAHAARRRVKRRLAAFGGKQRAERIGDGEALASLSSGASSEPSGSGRAGRRGSVMRTAVPRPRRAVERQRAAMRLDEALGDRQAEPGPAVASRRHGAGLPEWLQGAVGFVRGHADAMILDFDHDRPVTGVPGADLDSAALMRELDRVRQQVEQNLLEGALVADQQQVAVRQIGDQMQLAGTSPVPERCALPRPRAGGP